MRKQIKHVNIAKKNIYKKIKNTKKPNKPNKQQQKTTNNPQIEDLKPRSLPEWLDSMGVTLQQVQLETAVVSLQHSCDDPCHLRQGNA